MVDQINAQPTNSDLDVVYTPDNAGAVVQPVEVLVPAQDLYVQGEVEKTAEALRLTVPATVLYATPLPVAGLLAGADADTTVRIYEQPSGQDQKLAATVPATLANDGSAHFQTVLPPVKSSTVVTVVWDGDADHLASSAHDNRGRGTARLAHRQPGHGERQAQRTLRREAHARAAERHRVPGAPCRQAVGAHRRTAGAGPLSGSWGPSPGTYKLQARFSGSAERAHHIARHGDHGAVRRG